MPVEDQGARAAGHQVLARLLRPVQERLCLGDVVEGSVLLRQRGSGPALGCVNASCAAGRGPGRAVPGGRLGTGRPALGTRRRASGCFPAGRARWAAVGGGSMRERRFAADGAGGARRGRLPLALPGKAVRSPQRGPDPPGHHLSAWPSSRPDRGQTEGQHSPSAGHTAQTQRQSAQLPHTDTPEPPIANGTASHPHDNPASARGEPGGLVDQRLGLAQGDCEVRRI